MQYQYIPMTGRPDQVLAAGVEENKKNLLSRNPKLSELEAMRQALLLATRHNPGLLDYYRSYGESRAR